MSTKNKLIGIWHCDTAIEGIAVKSDTILKNDMTWSETGKYSIFILFDNDYSASGKWEIHGEHLILTTEESNTKLIPTGMIDTMKIIDLTDDTLIVLADGYTISYKKVK
jgi:hypothetical protein